MGSSNTKTVQNSITWAAYFVGNRPLAVANGVEPALESANMVVQTMLQPPLRYRWNRNTVTFQSVNPAGWTANTVEAIGNRIIDSNGNMQTVTNTTSDAKTGAVVPVWSTTVGATTTDNHVTWTMSLVSDYLQAVSDFGFIEKAQLATSTGSYFEIPNVKEEATSDSGSGRFHTIIPYLDDNNGNITFRTFPGIPDQTYTVNVIYQKTPTLLTGLTSVWPIPDRYSHVYNKGFLGFIQLFANKAAAFPLLQQFVAGVLALSEGLTEQERFAFLETWNITLEQAKMTSRMNQGLAARSAM